MTDVQIRTWHEAYHGNMDVIARSPTGTGKTLAFLLPGLQRVLDDSLDAVAGNDERTKKKQQQQQERQEQRQATTEDEDEDVVVVSGGGGGQDSVHYQNYENVGVKMLILAPTRELARQTGDEIRQLVFAQQHDNDSDNKDGNRTKDRRTMLSWQVMHGGVPKRTDVYWMERYGVPDVLVATPGRLLDHMESTTSIRFLRGDASSSNDNDNDDKRSNSTAIKQQRFVNALSKVQVLVLDEMDRLLSTSFRNDVLTIVSHLPAASDRQTLLFSATATDYSSSSSSNHDVLTKHELVRRDRYVFLDCNDDNRDDVDENVDEDEDDDVEDDEQQHDEERRESSAMNKSPLIQQWHVVLPQGRMIAGFLRLLLHVMKHTPEHKIVVFFPTKSQVTYYSTIFNQYLGRRVLEMHSGKSQTSRNAISESFRGTAAGGSSSAAAVLFTTDISARGMDYPDVTHVIQVGAAVDRETYVHRLGRTGRAGRTGVSILVLLSDTEENFVRNDLRDFYIPLHYDMQNLVQESFVPEHIRENMSRIALSMRYGTTADLKLQATAQAMYRALFGYYSARLPRLMVGESSNSRSRSGAVGGGFTSAAAAAAGEVLVDMVNAFAKETGLVGDNIPTISSALAKKMGVYGHPRLHVLPRGGLSGDSSSSTGSGFDVGRGRGLRESTFSAGSQSKSS